MNSLSDKKTLWISIYHPGEIISAIGMSLLFRDKYKINLFIKNHPYWKRINENFYKKYFNNIYHFPDVGFSKHFLREIIKIINIKKILKKLVIKNDDVYLTLSNKTFVDNIFLSIYKNHQIFKFSSRTECLDSLEVFLKKNKNYKEIITSKIWNLTIIPFFNLQPIVYLQHQTDKGLYEIVYKRGDKSIFSKFLYFNSYDDNNLKEDDIYNFLPFIKDKFTIVKSGNKKNIVVFFGEGRDHYDKYHCDFTNQCLRYIEKFFPQSHLIYKPHPIDVAGFELNNLELGKFEVYNGGEMAEIFLLDIINKIECCFSISSTSLRKAIDLDIRSYYFLKLYIDYSLDFYNLMLLAAGKIDDAAFIKSFNFKPSPYQICTNNLEKFNNHIYKIDKYF